MPMAGCLSSGCFQSKDRLLRVVVLSVTLLAGTLGLCAANALACDTMRDVGDVNWRFAGWSEGHPPTEAEEACIPAHTEVNIIEGAEATASSFRFEGSEDSVEIGKESSLTLAGSETTTIPRLYMYGTAALRTDGVVRVTHEFTWNGNSTISGSGEMLITSGVKTGLLNPDEGGTLTFDGSTFVNDGGLVLYNYKLVIGSGSRFINNGTFEVGTEGEAITGSLGVFTNNGKFEKNNNSEAIIEVPFENLGSVRRTRGKLVFGHVKQPEPRTTWGESNPSSSVGHHPPAHCGDPVSCATGNFSETQTDFSIGGRGVGLDLVRTYNSQAAAEASTPGPFGYGWTSSFSDHLVVEKSTEKATLVQANGSTVPFTEKSGAFTAPSWSQDTLTGTLESGYTVTLADQTKYKFNGSTGKLESVTNRDGNATTVSYNGEGRLETITDPAGRKITLAYNSEGLVESAKDPMGHSVKYTYEGGNLVSVTQPGESSLRWKFKYNSAHEITTMTDGRGGETTNEYNSSHQVTMQKDPAGRVLKFEYEPLHTTITNENTGSVTEEFFTSQGEPSTITHGAGTFDELVEEFLYNEHGQVVAAINGEDDETTYEYDSAGDRIRETNPDGDETHWTYDSKHDVETETTPEGETTTYKRNSDGEPETIERPAPGGKTQKTTYKYNSDGEITSETNPLEQTRTFEYDAKGDRTAEVDPEGNKHTWEYNEDSQVTATVSPKGNVKGAEASKYTTKFERNPQGLVLKITDPLGHTTKYTYDGDGNVETVTDGNSHTTTYVYNGDNQPIKIKEPNGTVTETEYDGAGRIISQTDGNKHTTKYVRNVLGQVIEIVEPLERITGMNYDNAGDLDDVVHLEGPEHEDASVTEYKYDADGRLTKIEYSGEATHSVEYEYNKDGNRTKMIDGTGTTVYTYDQLQRMTETENGHKEKVKYEYSLGNEQTKITYPNGKAITLAYDKDDRLEKVTDWSSRSTKFSYDPDSDLTTIAFPSETKDEDKYVYNEADQMSEAKMSKSTETLASLAYTRDNDGQVKKTVSKGLPGEETVEDTYDENNRLTKAGTTTYEYDAANDPTKIEANSYSYNSADELEKGGGVTYEYNELGERAKATPSGAATTYSYNQAGVLTSIERPEAEKIAGIKDSYTYDGNGLRASETISGKTSYFAWDLTESLPLLLSDGTNSYIYGPGGLPVEQINNSTGAVLYLHHDQQGSTRLLTGSTGKVKGKCTYSAYGHPTCEGTASPLGYNGQYTSPDTGLIYMRARVYDPSTAQFLSVDPLLALTGEPYSYVGDNPLNVLDPSGQCGIICVGSVVLGGVALATGVGEVVVGGAIVTEGVLGAVSAASGLASVGADTVECVKGDHLSCVGAAVGGVAAGGAGVAAIGAVTGDAASGATAIGTSAGALSLAGDAAGAAVPSNETAVSSNRSTDECG
jgi:RHS repeat-associated protein